jgi:uncharacterized membrane protein
MGDRRERLRLILAVIFILAGMAHLVAPGIYRGIMPPWVPAHDLMIFLSGVAEIAGGLGLLLPQFRVGAAIGLILLLLAVYPANFQMLFNARERGVAWWYELGLWLRLPLQIFLIGWVWKVRKTG